MPLILLPPCQTYHQINKHQNPKPYTLNPCKMEHHIKCSKQDISKQDMSKYDMSKQAMSN